MAPLLCLLYAIVVFFSVNKGLKTTGDCNIIESKVLTVPR